MKRFLILMTFCYINTQVFAQMVNNGATIVIEAGATLILNGNDLNINDGTISNSGVLEVNQDLKNTGTITSHSSNSKITFTGSSSSLFTVGSTTLAILDLRKNNADVELSGDLEIGDLLSFNSSGNSKLLLNDSDLTIESSAIVTGASALQYIETNGPGSLIKEMTGPGTFSFPVGNSQGQSALESVITGTSFANAKLKVRVSDTKEPNVPGAVVDYLNRYWVVEAENIVGYENAVVGEYLPTDVVGTESLIEGASYDGTSWSFLNASRGISNVSGTLTGASVNFTGRENAVPLPVDLLDFSAEKASDRTVRLSWTTASELNTSHYVVERSTNAIDWKNIGNVVAVGTSSDLHDYEFVDESATHDASAGGVYYYRLHIIDFDGYNEYSSVDAVLFGGEQKALSVYPNPTRNVVNFVTNEESASVAVFNSLGKLVKTVNTTDQVDLTTLPEGIYQLSVKTGDRVQTATVIKNN